MGCDIHLYVERKNDSGTWESADKWTEEKYDDEVHVDVDYEDRFYTGRNYNLFAILADVRNGRGFAGIRTGDGFNPIHELRGLPEDVSENVSKASDQWGRDGHSHSWATIQELLEYDWTQETGLSGVVDAPTLASWNQWGRKQGESPKEWCGMIAGRGVRIISEEELTQKIDEIRGGSLASHKMSEIQDELKDLYAHVSWTQKYYQCASNFLSETLSKLLRVGKPENVRIVFWFDN